MALIIVDANCRSDVFGAPCTEDGECVLIYISRGNGILVFGGKKYRRELFSSHSIKKFVLTLWQAGRAKSCNDTSVDNEEQRLATQHKCRSDDEHIIALAKHSGCRLLFSKDKDLISDFKSKSLLDNPRGKIYSTKKNKGLLK